ncbi:class I SAM-dependent methyltransferase [Primorskyibacter sp. 2E233]|uniref:class I SAM-dependent methyltransferase n=1 Tax=Primorskyibacter sp. 2E233 TaxID=3413431 RepID=UPI003BF402B6
MNLKASLSNLWRRIMLRGTTFGGKYRKVQMLYILENPWEMDSPKEQHRFRETLAHLSSLDTPFHTILELGCGEGHQSLHLQTICTQVFGVDISDMAVRRARERCPDGQFSAIPLEQIDSAFEGQHFDMITACEVLYYAVDITESLKVLQSRAERIYVSNFESRAAKLRHHFQGDGWRSLEPIRFEDTVWECAVWEAPHLRLS